jgi:hypothetical protein
LSDVGEALSRIDLAETLYPTERMKDTVMTLNCHIMTFLCRALDWYESSSFSRAVQSFARPAALRYDDLIEDINKALSKVTDLSVAGSQAEQRDMHEEMRQEQHAQQGFRSVVQTRLDEMQHQLNALALQKYSRDDLRAFRQQMEDLTTLVQQISKKQTSSEQVLLQELVVMKQDIHATQVDIRHQLSEVQFDQALSFIFSRCAIDHKVAYENAFLLRRVRRVTSGKCAPFWNSQQLQTWDRATSHSSIVLTSTFHDRLNIRDFCVGVIEQLLQSRIPIFWIIQQKDQGDQKHNIFEVLKSLIVQSVSKAPSPQTDVGISFRVRALEAATSIADYMSLLVDALSQFSLAYIVIDASAVTSDSMDDCREVLWKMTQLLRQRNKDTVLKIMLAGHGLSRQSSVADTRQENIVRVAQTSKKKSKRVPQAPLKGRRRPSSMR